MRPKKIRDLIPEVAKEQGIPEQDMNDIISLYFKEVRSSLSNIDTQCIHMEGLGRFNLKGWRLKYAIRDKKLEISRAKLGESVKKRKEELEILEKGNVLWDKYITKRKEIKEVRNKNRTDESQG